MKSSVKITCCGVVSALASVVMLGTNLPVMLFAVPTVAGILFMIPAIEFGSKWAFLCYFVTAVLSFILPTDREAAVIFVCMLGYYPILKMIIERRSVKTAGYLIKFAVFNVSVFASYEVITRVLGIDALANEKFGFWVSAIILLVAGNIAFFMLDFAMTKLIQGYFVRFRRQVRRIMGLKGKY